MTDLAEMNMELFLDELADRTPTPGGGGATALVVALACALARMVAAYSIGKKTDPSNRARIEAVMLQFQRADQLARALITRDAEAYKAMTEAARAAKTDPSARAAWQDAVLTATAVPMEVAAIASNALAAMEEIKAIASRWLLSDLGVAAVVADAASSAASYTISVNAGQLDGRAKATSIRDEIQHIVQHCARHREAIEVFVRDRLENGSGNSR